MKLPQRDNILDTHQRRKVICDVKCDQQVHDEHEEKVGAKNHKSELRCDHFCQQRGKRIIVCLQN